MFAFSSLGEEGSGRSARGLFVFPRSVASRFTSYSLGIRGGLRCLIVELP